MIAVIPARSGSVRVKNKNIKLINGHPLIAYTIEFAKKSKIFDKIIFYLKKPRFFASIGCIC
jgi:CMP-N-acetylneuraminic acid synthetase